MSATEKIVTDEYFRIDWAEFKTWLRAAVDGNVEGVKGARHSSRVRNWLQGSSWQGYTAGQIRRWLSDGFETDAMHGLQDLVPPIRDKRKLIHAEEGDEYHHDMMLSGNDNFMSSWSKRESIPGVAIEAGIMFSASTDAATINAYMRWLCKIAYSLEMSGIDTEVTLDFPSRGLNERHQGIAYHNVVRVKREGEASDFHSWSPMLSPAAFRAFGFCLGVLHAESSGFQCSGSFGRGMRDRTAWVVRYDADRRVLVIENNYIEHGNFPEADMTRQFRAALREMQGKTSG